MIRAKIHLFNIRNKKDRIAIGNQYAIRRIDINNLVWVS